MENNQRATRQDPMQPIGAILSKVTPQLSTKMPNANLTGEARKMDEPTYTCSICHDFQWIDPRREDRRPDYSKIEPCLCVKAELAVARKQALVKWCELPVGTDKMTFENFKVTPKTQEAYNAAVEMADGKFEQPFLTFLGDPIQARLT